MSKLPSLLQIKYMILLCNSSITHEGEAIVEMSKWAKVHLERAGVTWKVWWEIPVEKLVQDRKFGVSVGLVWDGCELARVINDLLVEVQSRLQTTTEVPF